MNNIFIIIYVLIFSALGISIFMSVFSLIKTFFSMKKLDELQKSAVYESFALTFLIILGIHFVQLIVSILAPEPFSQVAKVIISPGDYNGALITNGPLHFDSFFVDSFILSIVYYIKRKKYGLI